MPETNADAAVREPRTVQELASALQAPLLDPQLTEEDIASGCEQARRNGLRSIVVRPSDLDLAARWTGPSLILGAAVDWPHGYSTTAVKQYAVRDALRRGARDILVAMNTGKLISRQFQYLEMEVLQLAEACHEEKAVLTVHLESQYLTEEHKIVACRIAKRAEVDYLATASAADVALLAQYTRDRVELMYRDTADLAPEARLESILAVWAAGATRVDSPNAAELLQSLKIRLAAMAGAAPSNV